jgi:hypothetical protein
MTGRQTDERQGIKARAVEFVVFKDACRGGSFHAACGTDGEIHHLVFNVGGGAVHQMRMGREVVDALDVNQLKILCWMSTSELTSSQVIAHSLTLRTAVVYLFASVKKLA